MSFISEFREFALRGNVLNLAIGVIIGASFEKIVSSLVEDVITPVLLNPALETTNVKNLQELSLGSVKYGVFLASTINFIMVAFVLFLVVKAANAARKKEEAAAEVLAPPAQEVLLTEIRDLLKKNNG